jgi:hypothetical protein
MQSLFQLRRVCLAVVFLVVVSTLLVVPARAVEGGRGTTLRFLHRLEVAGGGALEDVAIAGRYAYLASGSAGLRIADVGDPFEPPQYIQFTDLVPVQAVTASGGYLYAVAQNGDLLVYSLAVPQTPEKLRTLPLGLTGKVYVEGGLAVAPTSTGLSVLDLVAPATPQAIGSLAVEGVQELAVQGGVVYLVRCCERAPQGAVATISLADPTAPLLLDEYLFGPETDTIRELGLGDGVIYAGGGGCADICTGSLHVIDRTSPGDLSYLGSMTMTPQRPTGAFAPPRTLVGDGRLAFVTLDSCRFSCTHLGVEAIDASAPATPRSLRYTAYPSDIRGDGFEPVGDGARQPISVGSRLFIPFGPKGLVIFDIGRHQVFLPFIHS